MPGIVRTFASEIIKLDTMGLFDSKTTTADGRELSRWEQRVEERSFVKDSADVISDGKFNLVMGATVAYGLVMNAIMVLYLSAPLYNALAATPSLYWVILIGYIVFGIAGSLIAQRSDNPLISFVGYNMLVLPLGVILALYVPAFNPAIVAKAIALTGFISLLMMGLGSAFPRLFLSMGRTLGITLLIGIFAELLSVFIFGYSGTFFDAIFAIVFSLYIGFDFARSQAFAKTVDNAVDSALDIYLDIIILFMRLLSILSKRN